MEDAEKRERKDGEKDPRTTYSLSDNILTSTSIDEQLTQQLEALKPATSTLQLEVVMSINARPTLLHEYISNDDNLPKRGSGVFNCKHDNTNALSPGGVGAIRIVNEGLFETSEKIVYNTFPMYCYSLCHDLFGYANHLCAWICVAKEDGTTLLVVRTYAEEVGNAVTNWTGKKIFLHCEKDGMKNLKTIVKKWDAVKS